jgi:hypothetical protein
MRYLRAIGCFAAAAFLAFSSPGALAQPPREYRVKIVVPKNEQAVFNNLGDVDVRIGVAPHLASGDQVELWLDEAPVPPKGTARKFHLAGLGPGRHTLQAKVSDASGNAMASSPPITFYMRHASKLYPNRK